VILCYWLQLLLLLVLLAVLISRDRPARMPKGVSTVWAACSHQV
jgi:hypothetical protein